MGFVEVSGPHDAFSWWAEIFIPALVGAGTVLVSYAAFEASRRATEVAAELERQRELNEAQRSGDERKRRLQDMALEEARVLNRLVVETYVSLPGMRDQRSELKQAEIDARVALEQSIVPGAETLYGITVYDLKNRFMYIVIHDEESVLVKAWKRRIERRRHERTKGRIRAWALDPEAQVATLDAESRDIHDAPLDYLMFGEDPTPAA
ncbi:MAG: hypothetical protein IJO71_01500 [Microbacterium sp.]|uniref:hypothetical protein n=1 Tax=Microbacterium sp. TaxID=51671 RepID=UPI0025EFD53A|nr:hypothetical protein [Microbacterium sp.]MBQ9915861.1 hypothetical protein [Microbacterium sp.]